MDPNDDQIMQNNAQNPQLSAQEQRNIRLKRLAEQKTENAAMNEDAQKDGKPKPTLSNTMPSGFQDHDMSTSPLEIKEPLSQTMGEISSQVQGTPDERLTHQMISDVYLITNEPGKLANSQSSTSDQKVYLHGINQNFTFGDLDILIVSRLGKQRDENKFSYLYQAYERIGAHLGAKRKNKAQEVADMKTITARYFVTCLTSPDTFDLTNDSYTYHDLKELGEHMQPNPENLGSGKDYSFSKMQNNLWECAKKNHFIFDREFMKTVFAEINDQDPDSKKIFFKTMFDKAHLELSSIRAENFSKAEQNLGILKALIELDEGAAEIFTSQPDFYTSGMNGQQLQRCTYFGRYLSFSALMKETTTWKETQFNVQLRKMREEQQQRLSEQVSLKFFNLQSTLAEVFKKLMKNPSCKEKLLKWMRHAVDLNTDKQKMMTHKPVASNGFVLNYISLLLQLCKPFIADFTKYGQFIGKINCFYLSTNSYVKKAKDFEKIESSNNDKIEAFLKGSDMPLNLSGKTLNPMVEGSSLMEDNPGKQLSPPNFITECFFLVHILISFMSKRLEQEYRQNNSEINDAIDEKDWEKYEDASAYKLCLDVHVFGKGTLGLYRSLFSFTNTLVMAIGSKQSKFNKDTYTNLFVFLEQTQVGQSEDELYADFQALPQLMFHNLNSMPKLFKQLWAEAYVTYDNDMHLQLAGSISVILNRKIQNPHLRIEFIDFLLQITPQKNVSQSHEKRNRLYKDVFFINPVLQNHLMQALIVVYIDSEKTDYYGKFSYRYAASSVMEYIFSEEAYRRKFIDLSKKQGEDFQEFCNLLINDMNSLLFDGLLALEEIKNYEENLDAITQLPQEEREQAESNYKDKKRKAKGTLQLSNMVIQLLSKVTSYCQEPFISEELGVGFANALNFCLERLATQRGLKFRIQNPERFHFEPKGLLVNIITMYANMSGFEAFKKNVVSDDRSYSDETFEKAAKILTSTQKNIPVGATENEKFQQLVVDLKNQKKIEHENELQFDDAPDEFLDPLTCRLMDDPVELPGSKTIIDRVTIKKHLMNDPHDPFNRAPLSIEQVIDRPDILEQIEEYKNEKLALKMSMQ